ncbi:13997_t:CDS:1 [Acaulospora morrowiae]|uniref:13997_t:CDS:1 n=1 Tax=Acaulospora morrowiae TaxID=94023 RepID=A0A9N8WCL5_9GLOM|nr:13997_t:CDS:1 [Acaulospora morrowiae]
MKFNIVAFALTLVSILLLTSNSAQACEASCQVGISKAFSDAYTIEIDSIFSKFVKDLSTSSLFDGVKIHTSLKAKIVDAITSSIKNQKNNFEGNLVDLVKNSIFNEKPRFKGQCQNPLRVVQPPAGVNWTLTDCEKQDYICGNPPAICHFMNGIVKPRNVNDINSAFASMVNSASFLDTVKKGIESAASNGGLKGKDLDNAVNGITNNFQKTLPGFNKTFVEDFCAGIKGRNATTCDKYDDNIKSILLSFP